MDLSSNSTVVKTPEAETETPTRIQPAAKPSPPFTNGVLKRHPPPPYLHHHPVVVTYKECLKNHAAALGSHAVDGCGEFMPSPASNPADPTSLKCAACGCHRNFHRREPDEPPGAAPALEYRPHHRHHPPPPPRGNSPDNSPSPPPISSSFYPASAPHLLLALSHGLSGPPPPESNAGAVIHGGASTSPMLNNSSSSRKRYRTRFTQEQKEKMLEFAEKVGWKMQRKDEDLIGEFCGGIGVDKGVFKVWMHNNKNTFGKKDNNQIQPHLSNISTAGITNPPGAAANGGGIGYSGMNAAVEGHYRHHQGENVDRKENVHDNSSPNIHGSSSSS